MSVETGERTADGRAATIAVAYVDDYEELCELTADSLEEGNERLEVTSITDPTTVTDRLEEFDCVVSDYEMPTVDGLELLRQVRVLDGDLPFILFTGQGSEDVASDAISLGVTDYMTKIGGPERFVRLAHRIESVVDARRATDEVATTRERANEVVERERAKFRALIEHSPAMTVVLDEHGTFQYCSPSVEDVAGYAPRDLRGETAFDYIHEADRERIVREFQRCLETPEYRPTVEYRFRGADGEWLQVESKGVNRLEDPAVRGFVVNTRDVTDRARTERRLSRERAVAEGVLDATPAPTFVLDDEAVVRRANRRATAVFERERGDLEGGSLSGAVVRLRSLDGETVGPAELVTRVVATGEVREGVAFEVTLSGGRVAFTATVAPLSGPDLTAVVVTVTDADPVSDSDGADGDRDINT